MARMFPQHLPVEVCRDKKRSSEVKVYDNLKKTLPDDYVVFYSVAWLARGSSAIRHEDYAAWLDKPYAGAYPIGEADFVILHPRKGVLVLEVKGGRLELEAGNWYSRDRNDQLHDIHSPVEQAKKNLFTLLNKLREHPRLRQVFFQAGYGVILPDCSWPEGAASLEAITSVSACHSDMGQLGQRISGVMNYWQSVWTDWKAAGHRGSDNSPGQNLSAEDMETIIDYLAPTLKLKRPFKQSLIREQQAEILNLTQRQFSLLSLLSRQRRALIGGGAGTGKTVLAMEKARQLAAAGYRTLFTCTNKLLAENLRAGMPAMENLTILNFHQLCFQWAKRAGITLPDPDGKNQTQMSERFFNEELPLCLLQSLDTVPDRFDALVVDEGQDFFADWWDTLLLCLANPDQDICYVFYDHNQNIWSDTPQFPFNLEPYVLTENLRTTRQIHALLAGFFHGGEYRAAGPEGAPAEYVELSAGYDPAELQATLLRIVTELISREKIRPTDIAILTGRRQNQSLLPAGFLGRYPLTQVLTDSDKLLFTSIRRFKGMERPVVILIELESLVADEQPLAGLRDRLPSDTDLQAMARGILYVGLSRAQNYLYVVETKKVLGKIAGGCGG